MGPGVTGNHGRRAPNATGRYSPEGTRPEWVRCRRARGAAYRRAAEGTARRGRSLARAWPVQARRHARDLVFWARSGHAPEKLPLLRPGHTVKGNTRTRSERIVVVLGVILLIIGFLTGISILWTIGIILLVIGAVLWLLGTLGHAVGGRRHYW